MASKQQKVTIKIDNRYNKQERQAIAQDIINTIIERTQSGKDKKGVSMGGYSPSYKKSLDFKIGGKSNKVNLTLTSEMLESMQLIRDRAGSVTIGYDSKNKKLNGKVEGNRKGTYGNKTPVTKPRDYLGISQNLLQKEVLTHYPLTSAKKRLERLKLIEKAQVASAEVVGATEFIEEVPDGE